ncbi:MAG: GLPGLI family protein [Chitinophagaceae bacterium]
MKTIQKIMMVACVMFCYYVQAQNNGDFVANLRIFVDKYDIKSPEKVDGVVVYQQTYRPDTLHLDSTQVDTMALSYSIHFSDYRAKGKRELDSTVSIMIDRISKLDPASPRTERFPSYKGRLSRDRFLGNDGKMYEYQDVVQNYYLVKYVSKKTDWKIEDSTKNVCGYLCQKAEADVLGRHYIAWFTTDVPGTFGPRTLAGLPGMILQAYDNTGQITYNAIQVFAKNNPNTTIGLPAKGIVCTKKEYDAMMEAFEKNPQAFFAGQKNVVAGSAVGGRGGGNPNKPKKVIPQNSIELKMEE